MSNQETQGVTDLTDVSDLAEPKRRWPVLVTEKIERIIWVAGDTAAQALKDARYDGALYEDFAKVEIREAWWDVDACHDEHIPDEAFGPIEVCNACGKTIPVSNPYYHASDCKRHPAQRGGLND